MRLRHIKGAEEQIAESPLCDPGSPGLKGENGMNFLETRIRSVSRWVWERENSSWNWRKRIRM